MKSKRARLTKRLDDLCRDIVRLTTNSKCQKCGKTVEGFNSHLSHVIPKGNGASWRRFDLHNHQHMCFHDHMMWWHKSPTEAGVWFADNWPHLDEYLDKYKGGKPSKISIAEMEELVIQYKEKVKELRNDN